MVAKKNYNLCKYFNLIQEHCAKKEYNPLQANHRGTLVADEQLFPHFICTFTVINTEFNN